MDVKEKLVELLRNSPHLDIVKGYKGNDCTFEQGADWLITRGVTVQECKLGDKKTNADQIRAMIDTELEEFICSLLQCEYCKFGTRGGCELLEWLEQPDKEGNNEAG